MLNLSTPITNTSSYQHALCHPDFIIYHTTEAQYTRFWQSLMRHPKSQLYTDGLQVKPVNWFHYQFERVKGWLGWTNHCQQVCVEMTLAKIAYYGYLKGYKQPQNYPCAHLISNEFSQLTQTPRSDDNSRRMQTLLMNYFHEKKHHFPAGTWPFNASHRFGHTLIVHELTKIVPSLDPQDPTLIKEVIAYFNHHTLTSPVTFKNSQFAKAFGNYLVTKKTPYHLEQALYYDDDIIMNNKMAYIGYFLQKKNKSDALTLILALDNNLIAAKIIKEYYLIKEQTQLLLPVELRQALAKLYIEAAEQEHNRSFLINYLFDADRKSRDYLIHAVWLDDHCLAHNKTQEARYICYQFSNALIENRFSDAFKCIESNPSIPFNNKDKDCLETYLRKTFQQNDQSIEKALNENQSERALQLAEKSITIANQIAYLNPSDNPTAMASIKRAIVLLKNERLQHPTIETTDIQTLNKGIALLKKYYLINLTPALLTELTNALMRKVDFLVEKIRVPLLFDTSRTIASAHLETISEPLTQLKTTLNDLIRINKDSDNRAMCAKAYSLLGDIINYFDNNREASKSHFKQAILAMPANPYYKLQYYWILDEEETKNSLYKEIRTQLKTLGHDSTRHFEDWQEERWHKRVNQFQSKGFDIHTIPAQSASWFTSFM